MTNLLLNVISHSRFTSALTYGFYSKGIIQLLLITQCLPLVMISIITVVCIEICCLACETVAPAVKYCIKVTEEGAPSTVDQRFLQSKTQMDGAS